MYPVYYPGQLSRTIGTFIIFLIIFAIIATGGYIYYQGKKINTLQASLDTCEQRVDAEKQGKSFVEENLRIIKRNCARKLKPSVVEGKLKLENLFNGPPK